MFSEKYKLLFNPRVYISRKLLKENVYILFYIKRFIQQCVTKTTTLLMISAGVKGQNGDQFITNWFTEVVGPDTGRKENKKRLRALEGGKHIF